MQKGRNGRYRFHPNEQAATRESRVIPMASCHRRPAVGTSPVRRSGNTGLSAGSRKPGRGRWLKFLSLSFIEHAACLRILRLCGSLHAIKRAKRRWLPVSVLAVRQVPINQRRWGWEGETMLLENVGRGQVNRPDCGRDNDRDAGGEPVAKYLQRVPAPGTIGGHGLSNANGQQRTGQAHDARDRFGRPQACTQRRTRHITSTATRIASRKWNEPRTATRRGEGGTCVCGDEVAVRVCEGSLSWTEEEREPAVRHLRSGQPVYGSQATAAPGDATHHEQHPFFRRWMDCERRNTPSTPSITHRPVSEIHWSLLLTAVDAQARELPPSPNQYQPAAGTQQVSGETERTSRAGSKPQAIRYLRETGSTTRPV